MVSALVEGTTLGGAARAVAAAEAELAAAKTLAKLERGESNLKVDRAEAIARFLKVPVDQLKSTATNRMIRVRGYVGAGAMVFPYECGAD